MARKTPKRSAKARKPAPADGVLRRAATAGGAAIARNPALVGGSTAFLVSLFFVSANAMWYQPHFHGSAFFTTREVAHVLPLASDLIEDPEDILPPDPEEMSEAELTLQQVQTALADLRLYRGAVDGRMGEETSEAIAAYQKILGLPVSGTVNTALLEHLGVQTSTASIAPTAPVPSDPVGRPDEVAALIDGRVAAAAASDNDRVRQVQAGLRAFGNETVEVDGLMGAKTRGAIREFQNLFGLEPTGEPDEVVLAKMREIGLTN
jgi:peptidoglycan hydrolase-like protein with peptidoglycan-binding domain